MATVIPKYNRIVQDQPQQAFYMVSINTSGFLDTETKTVEEYLHVLQKTSQQHQLHLHSQD